MSNSNRSWRKFRSMWIRGVAALPCLWSLAGSAHAQELPILEEMSEPAIESPAAQPIILNLQQAIDLALEKQPAIAAARSSFASTDTNRAALERMKLAGLISRDLATRRKQATLGVSIAAYGIEHAEHEAIYAVTRLYYTVVFAREQKKVAENVVANLKVTLDAVKAQLKGGARDVSEDTVAKVEVYYNLASTRVVDAETGVRRATAALREAIGVGPHCCIKVVDDTFPELKLDICLSDILGLALDRRPEIQMAEILADITDLEIKAQATQLLRRSFRTFASASDIHAKVIPAGEANGDYRPGALAPEMPTTLVGPRSFRVERAEDLFGRSESVAEKTRNLIALEAEDVFLKVEQAANKVPLTTSARDKGRTFADNTRKAYTSGGKAKVEDVLTAEVLAAQAQAQYNEARHALILALAALERVTAGGFDMGLIKRPCHAH